MPKQIHKLLEVDPKTHTGVCAHCGPVQLKRKGPNRWRCKPGYKELQRKYQAGGRYHHPHRKFKGKRCERCGFVPEHPVQLDTHHIDGNHKNDSKDNIQTLCANCHRYVSYLARKGIRIIIPRKTRSL